MKKLMAGIGFLCLGAGWVGCSSWPAEEPMEADLVVLTGDLIYGKPAE